MQSLACWLLYREGFVEPLRTATRPYDILLHQALSTVKQLSGCSEAELIARLQANAAFSTVTTEQLTEILAELLRIGWLERIGQELIIGVEGEYIVNSRDFYSVFKTEPGFKVQHAGKTIGEIPLTPQVQENENLLLAARIWKIKYIDEKAKKIEVVPANDGKRPIFLGGGGVVDAKVREKMLQLLMQATQHPELDEVSQQILRELRQEFAGFALTDAVHQRPVQLKEGKLVLYTFTGTRINRSLVFLLNCLDMPVSYVYREEDSSFTLSLAPARLPELVTQLGLFAQQVDDYLVLAVEENPGLLDFAKWGASLPVVYQCDVLKERYFDFDGTMAFLQKLVLVLSQPQ